MPVTTEEMDISGSSTVSDIMAYLSAGGTDCVRGAAGCPPVGYGVRRRWLSLECLAPENGIEVGLAFLSAEARGLSEETTTVGEIRGLGN